MFLPELALQKQSVFPFLGEKSAAPGTRRSSGASGFVMPMTQRSIAKIAWKATDETHPFGLAGRAFGRGGGATKKAPLATVPKGLSAERGDGINNSAAPRCWCRR
ncbi:hypothetical protein C882_2800 [Caenispirillum salinarum AK4]|uniref:Uncharacterized protein n=1 Tax=Caenispirillum salinarum AK4 TaxID=1238182 RepID=K9GK31_9PROT|nr:hypothetical protein C882_2800 [Caenispirillum salinarum AK4]